jgi:hypothetical protein
VWEEKPLWVKTMGDHSMLWSITTSDGDMVIAAAAAMPWGWPEVQQSMGQLAGDGAPWISARSEVLEASSGRW